MAVKRGISRLLLVPAMALLGVALGSVASPRQARGEKACPYQVCTENRVCEGAPYVPYGCIGDAHDPIIGSWCVSYPCSW